MKARLLEKRKRTLGDNPLPLGKFTYTTKYVFTFPNNIGKGESHPDEKTTSLSCCLGILQHENPAQIQSLDI